VPRNKRDIDRAVKVDELLAAAEALFLRNGYAGTTMAAIAKQAGVSANSLYWYFPSKDDVFVAVLDRHLTKAQTRLATQSDEPLSQQFRWVLTQLEALAPMTGVIHERARESAVVAEFHDRFHQAVQGFLCDGLLREGHGRRDAERTAEVVMAIVEGPMVHGKSRKERDDLLVFAMDRLLS
jgi:TetR/AcrR family transcriptional regulator, regulator of autoinduction and epiphytic fitness